MNFNNFSSFHLIGICGSGMSGLAQALKHLGYEVSGSDRAINNYENEMICRKLSNSGIRLYSQDGSFAGTEKTDCIIYSTAIEKDNPDFLIRKDLPTIHRTDALLCIFKQLKEKTFIAVTGSCGKTTVTSWLTETLQHLGGDPFAFCGGFMNLFTKGNLLGNFKPGDGKYLVFEADESDKSLLKFFPDYSLILNIGTDHYSKEELITVFESFLRNTKKGAVIEKQVYLLLSPDSYKHLRKVIVFSDKIDSQEKEVWHLFDYKLKNDSPRVVFAKADTEIELALPIPGRYNALNALAVLALFDLLGMLKSKKNAVLLRAIEKYHGVHRRFEYAGKTINGTKVYCDFAHNVEKIFSIIESAQELSTGRVFAVFQPHGYKPFGFMKDKLFPVLEDVLKLEDRFILMPVYYSGGACTFTPNPAEVIEEYNSKTSIPKRYTFFEKREPVNEYLLSEPKDGEVILILGARDNSLPLWAKELTLSE